MDVKAAAKADAEGLQIPKQYSTRTADDGFKPQKTTYSIFLVQSRAVYFFKQGFLFQSQRIFLTIIDPVKRNERLPLDDKAAELIVSLQIGCPTTVQGRPLGHCRELPLFLVHWLLTRTEAPLALRTLAGEQMSNETVPFLPSEADS